MLFEIRDHCRSQLRYHAARAKLIAFSVIAATANAGQEQFCDGADVVLVDEIDRTR